MAWQTIGIHLKTETPTLLASAPPAGNLMISADAIPGSTIRGLLAHRYIEKHGRDQTFFDLFVTGPTCFGFGFIDGALPVPMSARTCKYGGGFAADGGHGIQDLLLKNCQESKDISVCRNPSCQQSLDYQRGYVTADGVQECRVEQRLITRTSIDPVRGAAAQAILYSQKVINEGQGFTALVEVPEELASHLIQLLHGSFSTCIGTGKSRGQGWVRVSQTEPQLSGWDKAEARAAAIGSNNESIPLIVTLLSDAIFVNEYLQDVSVPPVESLEALGIKPSQWKAQPQIVFSEVTNVFGFDGYPVSLPAIPRLAVRAGSVFAFEACVDKPQLPTGDGIGWVGDNNRNGFGRVALWHPFHSQYDASRDARAESAVPRAARSSAPTTYAIESVLLDQANRLYGLLRSSGKNVLSPAQLNRITALLRSATDTENAVETTAAFLRKQLAKLDKAASQGDVRSWRVEIDFNGQKTTIGKVLASWLKQRTYLDGNEVKDDLGALKKFWSYLTGLASFDREMGEPMVLDRGKRPDTRSEIS